MVRFFFRSLLLLVYDNPNSGFKFQTLPSRFILSHPIVFRAILFVRYFLLHFFYCLLVCLYCLFIAAEYFQLIDRTCECKRERANTTEPGKQQNDGTFQIVVRIYRVCNVVMTKHFQPKRFFGNSFQFCVVHSLSLSFSLISVSLFLCVSLFLFYMPLFALSIIRLTFMTPIACYRTYYWQQRNDIIQNYNSN